jgi:hypothetical protein
VAQSFIDNPNNYPVINHKDENKHNNNVDNLEWCTQKYNANYGNALIKKSKNFKSTERHKQAARLNALSRQIPVLQFSKTGEFIERYDNSVIAGKAVNTTPSHIRDVCNQLRHSAGGYIWRDERSVDLSEY